MTSHVKSGDLKLVMSLEGPCGTEAQASKKEILLDCARVPEFGRRAHGPTTQRACWLVLVSAAYSGAGSLREKKEIDAATVTGRTCHVCYEEALLGDK